MSGKLLYMFRVVSPPIIRNTHNCIYSIWYLLNRYCYLPLLWNSWNWFECGVGFAQQPHQNRSVQFPHHTQTSYTIAAGSSNGLISTRYCKYSCVLLMMGGDTTRNMWSSFPEINKLCNVASCWKYIKRNILMMQGPLNVKRNFI